MEDKIIGFKINSKGYGTIPKAAMIDKNLNIYAKALYAYFCSYTGGGDTCFPSRKKICYDLGVSIDTFGKYLKQLVENGYIKVEQIKENGRFSHNVYTLCDTISPCPKKTDTDGVVHGEMDPNNNNDNNNSINNNNSIEKATAKKRFTPPTTKEVSEYCIERGNNIDPEQFVAFYESKGWKVGNNHMKDWKSAIITWEKREKKSEKKSKQQPQSYSIEDFASYNIFESMEE